MANYFDEVSFNFGELYNFLNGTDVNENYISIFLEVIAPDHTQNINLATCDISFKLSVSPDIAVIQKTITFKIVEPLLKISSSYTPTADGIVDKVYLLTLTVAQTPQSLSSAYEGVLITQLQDGISFVNGSVVSNYNYTFSNQTLIIYYGELSLGTTAVVTVNVKMGLYIPIALTLSGTMNLTYQTNSYIETNDRGRSSSLTQKFSFPIKAPTFTIDYNTTMDVTPSTNLNIGEIFSASVIIKIPKGYISNLTLSINIRTTANIDVLQSLMTYYGSSFVSSNIPTTPSFFSNFQIALGYQYNFGSLVQNGTSATDSIILFFQFQVGDKPENTNRSEIRLGCSYWLGTDLPAIQGATLSATITEPLLQSKMTVSENKGISGDSIVFMINLKYLSTTQNGAFQPTLLLSSISPYYIIDETSLPGAILSGDGNYTKILVPLFQTSDSEIKINFTSTLAPNITLGEIVPPPNVKIIYYSNVVSDVKRTYLITPNIDNAYVEIYEPSVHLAVQNSTILPTQDENPVIINDLVTIRASIVVPNGFLPRVTLSCFSNGTTRAQFVASRFISKSSLITIGTQSTGILGKTDASMGYNNEVFFDFGAINSTTINPSIFVEFDIRVLTSSANFDSQAIIISSTISYLTKTRLAPNFTLTIYEPTIEANISFLPITTDSSTKVIVTGTFSHSSHSRIAPAYFLEISSGYPLSLVTVDPNSISSSLGNSSNINGTPLISLSSPFIPSFGTQSFTFKLVLSYSNQLGSSIPWNITLSWKSSPSNGRNYQQSISPNPIQITPLGVSEVSIIKSLSSGLPTVFIGEPIIYKVVIFHPKGTSNNLALNFTFPNPLIHQVSSSHVYLPSSLESSLLSNNSPGQNQSDKSVVFRFGTISPVSSTVNTSLIVEVETFIRSSSTQNSGMIPFVTLSYPDFPEDRVIQFPSIVVGEPKLKCSSSIPPEIRQGQLIPLNIHLEHTPLSLANAYYITMNIKYPSFIDGYSPESTLINGNPILDSNYIQLNSGAITLAIPQLLLSESANITLFFETSPLISIGISGDIVITNASYTSSPPSLNLPSKIYNLQFPLMTFKVTSLFQNQAPISTNFKFYSLIQGQTIKIKVTRLVTDPDSTQTYQDLDFSSLKIIEPPSFGSLSLNDSFVNYSSVDAPIGNQTFTFEICDYFPTCTNITFTIEIILDIDNLFKLSLPIDSHSPILLPPPNNLNSTSTSARLLSFPITLGYLTPFQDSMGQVPKNFTSIQLPFDIIFYSGKTSGKETIEIQYCWNNICISSLINIEILPPSLLIEDDFYDIPISAREELKLPSTFNVTANDYFDSISTFNITTFTVHGKLEILEPGIIQYTPNGKLENDTFVYQLCDSLNQCGKGTCTINFTLAPGLNPLGIIQPPLCVGGVEFFVVGSLSGITSLSFASASNAWVQFFFFFFFFFPLLFELIFLNPFF